MSQAIQTAPPGHYRVKHVVRSEVVKILTLRSTAITLGLTVVAGLLVTGLVTNAALHHGPGFYNGFDPTQESLTGLIVAGLTGGVFGALLITGEYSSGTIRTTLAATPRRPLLLAAKIGVTAAATVVFCELLSFVSFFLGQAILSGGGAPSAEPGVARRLPGRVHDRPVHRPHGPHVLRFRAHLPQHRGRDRRFRRCRVRAPAGDARHLRARPPLRADQHPHQLDHGHRQPGTGRDIQPLSPAVGLLLMAIYAAIALAAGAVLFVRRDA